jgi:hypothetical protein
MIKRVFTGVELRVGADTRTHGPPDDIRTHRPRRVASGCCVRRDAARGPEEDVSLHADRLFRRLLPRPPAGRVLHPREHRVLEHLAAALLEDAPARVPPGEVADNVERFLRIGGSSRVWQVRYLLHLIEHLPQTVGYRRRFTRLGCEAQRDLVRRHMMQARGLWALAARARLLVVMGAYGDARAANAETGYVAIGERPRFRAPRARRACP